MLKKKLVIVTPVYKKEISENEYLSIKSVRQHLDAYDRVIVAPKKFLNDYEFIDTWKAYGYKIYFLDNSFFLNVSTYNQMMMNKAFYQQFFNYEYMLIAQLDVLIFSNSLDYWMEKELDYVGAPWIIKDFHGIRFNFAGNGGLSLRKIDTFVAVFESNQFFKKVENYALLPLESRLKNISILAFIFKLKLTKYTTHLFRFLYKGQEDYFWTYYAPFFLQEFKVANLEDSLAFAFERYPEFCFEQNNHCMPFGVHAWEKHNPKFWKKYKPSLFTHIDASFFKEKNSNMDRKPLTNSEIIIA